MDNPKKPPPKIIAVVGLSIILFGLKVYVTGEWSKLFMGRMKVDQPKIFGVLVMLFGVGIISEWAYLTYKSKKPE